MQHQSLGRYADSPTFKGKSGSWGQMFYYQNEADIKNTFLKFCVFVIFFYSLQHFVFIYVSFYSLPQWSTLTSSLRFCQRPQGLSSRIYDSSSLSSSSSVAEIVLGWTEDTDGDTEGPLCTWWVVLDMFPDVSSGFPSVQGVPLSSDSDIITHRFWVETSDTMSLSCFSFLCLNESHIHLLLRQAFQQRSDQKGGL